MNMIYGFSASLSPLTNDNISIIYSVHKTRKMRDYAAGVIGNKDVGMMAQKGGRKGKKSDIEMFPYLINLLFQ